MYYDPVGDFLFVLVIIIAFVMIFGGLFWALDSDSKHEDKMRQQFTQCQKDGKDWVLTGKNSLDGICVTKK